MNRSATRQAGVHPTRGNEREPEHPGNSQHLRFGLLLISGDSNDAPDAVNCAARRQSRSHPPS